MEIIEDKLIHKERVGNYSTRYYHECRYKGALDKAKLHSGNDGNITVNIIGPGVIQYQYVVDSSD